MPLSETDVVGMFAQEYSWEQILYKIIAVEAMDPWDLNISTISDGFVRTIEKAEILDFKVPAKYIMIAAVLLRMKAEHLDLVQGILSEQPEQPAIPTDATASATPPLFLNPLPIPPHRSPPRLTALYGRITSILSSLKKEEVPFSQVIGRWDRENVLANFIPLIYLDQNKQVSLRQNDFFTEIFVKKRETGSAVEEA